MEKRSSVKTGLKSEMNEECCIGKSTEIRRTFDSTRLKTLVPGSGEGLVSGMNADHTRDHTASLIAK